MMRLTAAMAAAAAVLACTSCSSGGHNPGTVVAASQPPADLTKPTASAPSDPGAIVTTGPIMVEQQIDVVALRAGIVAALNTDVGSGVRQGQMLARLDDRQIAADCSAAEFKVHSLESDLKNWQAEVDVRKTDLQRAEAMRQAGINTQEALDHVRYDLQATEFEVERQNNEMRSAQSALQSQQLEVRFTLPERDISVLRRGALVTVSPAPDFAQTTTASVTHLSPVVDPGSGTIEVTAKLTHNIPGLIPGMVASVRVARTQ